MNRNNKNQALADKLKTFDYHTSVANEFKVQTGYGAALSVVTILAIIYLITTELHYNLTPTQRERVHVNSTTPDGVEMEFDVTLPSVPCALLTVDAQDPQGQAMNLHIDKTHRIWKHRIGKDGRTIGRKSRFEMGNTLISEKHVEDMAKEKGIEFVDIDDDFQVTEEECGSCYGAEEEGECCNTCDDVKRAYQRKGWVLDKLSSIKQCKNEKRGSDEQGEGCNVHGIVALSEGGGNLHLAPGHELENVGKTFTSLADLIATAFDTFNVSHTVNKLRFGQDYPGDVNQLDGEKRMVHDAYGMYQYYIQIVPTLYKFLNGTTIQTSQYSVTEHMRHVTPGSDRGLPGVYFFYEVSALHVEIEEELLGYSRFLTSVAAVVGGFVSVMKMADAFVFSRTRRRSVVLG